jgi:hypothetical protein
MSNKKLVTGAKKLHSAPSFTYVFLWTLGYFKAFLTSLSTPQEIIVVKVGEEEQSFSIHKSLACFYSSYFKGAFQGNFGKGVNGQATLADTDPKIFGLVVHWLYFQKIDEEICEDKSLTNKQKFVKHQPSIHGLVDLWLLADYLGIPGVQNAAIDMISARVERFSLMDIDNVLKVYRRTNPGSLLRKFYVDIFCWRPIVDNYYLEHSHLFPKEMLIDLIIADQQRLRGQSERDSFKNMDNYHIKEMQPEEKLGRKKREIKRKRANSFGAVRRKLA